MPAKHSGRTRPFLWSFRGKHDILTCMREKRRQEEIRKMKPQLQMRLFRMVSVGVVDDPLNRGYDILSIAAIVANLIAAVCSTFDSLNVRWGALFTAVEMITVLFFAVDYVLRVAAAPCLYPEKQPSGSRISYMLSLAGIIDLLSFLPYYLPVFFPAGLAAFRMFRIVRILRLFRINAYYDQLNVITEVLVSKRQQLLASVFIILTLMVASSLCMYSLEHEAQPEVFSNAFSGIWWSVSTLLTVGYGDIYPITTLGKCFAILISFLGVGMVAIPTGIISAGFVEQFQKYKRLTEIESENRTRFVRVRIAKRDPWTGCLIKDLGLPSDLIVAAVHRGGEIIIPRGDLRIAAGDLLTMASDSPEDAKPVELKEIVLARDHEWVGQPVSELDLSRRTLIVVVRRNGTMLVPRPDLVLREGDVVYLYTKLGRPPGSDA